MLYAGQQLIGNIRPRLWVSGMTVAQWEAVLSPADGEIYRRIAATGGGTTDPADDWVNYIAVSFRRPTAIQNGFSAGGFGTSFTNRAVINAACLSATMALSAGVRTNVLSVTGRGTLRHASWVAGLSVSPASSLQYEVVLDDRSVFNAVSGSVSSTGSYVAAAGGISSGGSSAGLYTPLFADLQFRRNMSLWVTASAAIGNSIISHYYAYDLEK